MGPLRQMTEAGSQTTTEVENPHTGQGMVVLDIGDDIGALVVSTPSHMLGVEIEICPSGARDQVPDEGAGWWDGEWHAPRPGIARPCTSSSSSRRCTCVAACRCHRPTLTRRHTAHRGLSRSQRRRLRSVGASRWANRLDRHRARRSSHPRHLALTAPVRRHRVRRRHAGWCSPD